MSFIQKIFPVSCSEEWKNEVQLCFPFMIIQVRRNEDGILIFLPCPLFLILWAPGYHQRYAPWKRNTFFFWWL